MSIQGRLPEVKARRKTVADLWFNCTDEEIARFWGCNQYQVVRDRRVLGLNKYFSDYFIRPWRLAA